MPPYLQDNGQETPAGSVYPGLNAFAIGYKAVPGGPPSQANDQAEAVATGYKSKAICIASPGNRGYTQRQINWRVNYGTAPSVVAWVLQGSVDDVDGRLRSGGHLKHDHELHASRRVKPSFLPAIRFRCDRRVHGDSKNFSHVRHSPSGRNDDQTRNRYP